jgi:hypothetical protein
MREQEAESEGRTPDLPYLPILPNQPAASRNLTDFVVPGGGFEPPTPRL